MKNTIALFVFLLQILSNCYSQKGIVFKVQYIPNQTHKQTVVESSRTELKYIGSKTFLQNLKDGGTDNPTITNNLKKTESVLTTGKVSSDRNCFPITMEFLSTESKDGKKIFPDGTLIFGRGSIGSSVVFDSISSSGLSDELESTVLKAMNSTLSQVAFPDRELKVGESFSKETPITIPVSDTKFEMVITTTYKLIGIAKDIATFDIVQVYTMKSTITKYTLNATGNGNGKIIYDIKNHFYTNYETNINFNMAVKLDSFDFTVNSQSKFVQNITITNTVAPSTVFVSCEKLKQKEERDSLIIVRQNNLEKLDSAVAFSLKKLSDSTFVDSSGLRLSHSLDKKLIAQLKDSGRIENGSKEGLWAEYKIDSSRMNQRTEIALGKSKIFGNGSAALLKESGSYLHGQREGTWSYYFSLSETHPIYWHLSAESEYMKGQKNGKQIIFDGNDTAWIQSIVDGKEKGIGKKFDTGYKPSYLQTIYIAKESGSFVLESYYPSGLLKIKFTDTIIHNENLKYYKSFNEKGALSETGYYIRDTVRQGTLNYFYENGKVQSEENYKLGVLEGEYKFYHDNGKLWSVTKFSKGKPEEIISNFDRNGKRKDKGTLKNGNGTVIHYDEDGKQVSVDLYKNGERIEPK